MKGVGIKPFRYLDIEATSTFHFHCCPIFKPLQEFTSWHDNIGRPCYTLHQGCQTQIRSGPKLSSEVKSRPESLFIEKLTATDM